MNRKRLAHELLKLAKDLHGSVSDDPSEWVEKLDEAKVSVLLAAVNLKLLSRQGIGVEFSSGISKAVKLFEQAVGIVEGISLKAERTSAKAERAPARAIKLNAKMRVRGLKRALKDAMASANVVTFEYEKQNGETRTVNVIPTSFKKLKFGSGFEGDDVDRKGKRSFYIANIL